MRNIFSRLSRLNQEQKKVAVATIVQTRGSTPQVPGASALFSPEGLLAGTLGGGLLEAEAQQKAQRALKSAKALLYEFKLQDTISAEDGSICGGSGRILIDPSPQSHREVFQQLHQSLQDRKAGVLATFIHIFPGETISLSRTWVEEQEQGGAKTEPPFLFFLEEIRQVFTDGLPSFIETTLRELPDEDNESFLFLEYIFPLPRLVIAGAGHIGQALAHLGNLLDFEVTVVDDRPEFANATRIPDADKIVVDDIGRAIQNTPISRDTFIVIVTRGHRHDAEALRHCIASEAAYIGMIGSRRKIGLVKQKFLEEGWATPQQFDRIHAPIGVEINSETVQEIAVSIAAQLVLMRSKNQEKSCRRSD